MAEKQRADEEAAVAKAVNDFLRYDLLGMAGAEAQIEGEIKPDPNVKLATLLERARKTVGDRFNDQPRIKASILYTLGYAFADIGQHDVSEELLIAALDTFRSVVGEEHPDTWNTMGKLASAIMGQGHDAEAETRFRELLEIQRRVRGEEHPSTWGARGGLALAIKGQGRYTEAEQLLRELAEIKQRVLGEEHPDTLDTMNNLAIAIMRQGRYAEGEQRFRELLEIRRRVQGEEHPDTLNAMHNLALALKRQDPYAEAEQRYRELLEIRQRVQGKEHPETVKAVHNLTDAIMSQGRYVEAEQRYRELLRIRQQVQGEEHPGTLITMHNLALAIMRQARYAEAETHFREILEIEQRVRGEEHPSTLMTTNYLARSLVGATDTTLFAAEQAVELSQHVCELQPKNAACLNTLGIAHYRAGQWHSAIEALQKSIETGMDSPYNWLFIAMANWQLQKTQEAHKWHEKSLQWRKHNQPDDDLKDFFAEAKQCLDDLTANESASDTAHSADADRGDSGDTSSRATSR